MSNVTSVTIRDADAKPAVFSKPKGKKVLVFVGIEPEQLGDGSKLFSNAPPDLNDFEKQLSANFVGQLKKLESEGIIKIVPISSGDWPRIIKVIGEKRCTCHISSGLILATRTERRYSNHSKRSWSHVRYICCVCIFAVG